MKKNLLLITLIIGTISSSVLADTLGAIIEHGGKTIRADCLNAECSEINIIDEAGYREPIIVSGIGLDEESQKEVMNQACDVNKTEARSNTIEYSFAATIKLGFLIIGFKEQSDSKIKSIAQGALAVCGMAIDVIKIPTVPVYGSYQFVEYLRNNSKAQKALEMILDPELKGSQISVDSQTMISLGYAFYAAGE